MSSYHTHANLSGAGRVIVLIIATILAFCTLYAPQPLLPRFAQMFAIPQSQAGLLITVTMLPLSIAPLSYGYLLESLSALKLLRLSLLVLALTQWALGLSSSFFLLLAIRFVQGLVLPAAFTSLMTYISTAAEPAYMRRVMAGYIAATIVGGYLGRLLAGLFATFFPWQTFFFVIGAALLLWAGLLARLEDTAQMAPTRPTAQDALDILRTPAFLRMYVAIFCLFFVFAGLLNVLPFRLGEIHPQSSELLTGLVYSGYLIGVGTSLSSNRIAARFGGDSNTLLIGFAGFIATLTFVLVPDLRVLFITLCCFCGCMFLVHALAAGLVNQLAQQRRGIVNGFYVAFYYAGGVVGSYLPGVVYEYYGWQVCVLLLLLIATLGLAAVAGQS